MLYIIVSQVAFPFYGNVCLALLVCLSKMSVEANCLLIGLRGGSSPKPRKNVPYSSEH